MKRTRKAQPESAVRCAVYTRKSTEEGLEQEFNTLDAQRESAESYIASQQHEGWMCLPDRYDDGGYTGGNMERPALKRLMADIEDGKIDCVVVYKVDRLSRSLLDFARLMEVFDSHSVSFVSVTQQFNTANSMGRLVLNVLLSFAQFEREIISERTRDKIAAARRKGKWVGGHPILGYDVDPHRYNLHVNEDEAVQVRAIYDLYLEHRSLMAVVKELNDRGWNGKRWITRKGTERGGRPFNKSTLYTLLTNVVYLGKVKYKDEVHEGEHEGIVGPNVWKRVQQVLASNGRTGGHSARNKYGALLKGLLRCVPCGCSMGHTYSMKNGSVKYRYYVCLDAQKRGWHTCPAKSVPAQEIERIVVDQIKAIGRDPTLITATLQHARHHTDEQVKQLELEQRRLRREIKRDGEEIRRIVNESTEEGSATTARLGDLNERVRIAEQRLGEIGEQLKALERTKVSEHEVERALADFDSLWETLSPREQERIIHLLVERIDYDGVNGKVAMTFRETGLRSLVQEHTQEELAA